MTTKRILMLLFALIITISLAACNGEGEETAPETTEAIPETTAEAVDLDLHIVRDGASEYTAVRPDKAGVVETNAIKALRKIVKEKYGVQLDLDTDGEYLYT